MGKVSINESIWFHKIYAGSRDSRFAQPARLMCKGKLQLFDLILLSLKRCTYMKIPYPLRLSWFPQADINLRSTAWSNQCPATKRWPAGHNSDSSIWSNSNNWATCSGSASKVKTIEEATLDKESRKEQFEWFPVIWVKMQYFTKVALRCNQNVKDYQEKY